MCILPYRWCSLGPGRLIQDGRGAELGAEPQGQPSYRGGSLARDAVTPWEGSRHASCASRSQTMFLCHYETITVSTYQSLTHRPRLSCTRFSEFSRMQCAVALRSATTGHRTSVCMHPSFEANATDARVSTRQVGLAPCRVSQGKECLCAA